MSFIAAWVATRYMAVRAGNLTSRGVRAMGRGDNKEAIRVLNEALEVRKALNPAISRPVALASFDLASAYRANGDHKMALNLLSEVVSINQKVLSPSDPETPISMNNLAVVLRNTGQYDAAAEVFSEAVRLLRESQPPTHHDITIMLVNLARTDLMRPVPRKSEAEAILREAIDLRRSAVNTGQPDDLLADALVWLAEALSEKDIDAAGEALEEALKMQEELQGPGSSEVADVEARLLLLQKSE